MLQPPKKNFTLCTTICSVATGRAVGVGPRQPITPFPPQSTQKEGAIPCCDGALACAVASFSPAPALDQSPHATLRFSGPPFSPPFWLLSLVGQPFRLLSRASPQTFAILTTTTSRRTHFCLPLSSFYPKLSSAHHQTATHTLYYADKVHSYTFSSPYTLF